MSQRDVDGKSQAANKFHWPTSSYERLLGASAAGRQAHPPFVGSVATRCDNSENGRDFPSLIASDVVDGENAKVAAGDASASRRVRFSDGGTPIRNIGENVAQAPRPTLRPKPPICAGTPAPVKQSLTSRPPFEMKKPIRPAIKKSNANEQLGDLRNPADWKSSKSVVSNVSAVAKSAPSAVSIRKRSVASSSGGRFGTASEVVWSKNGTVNVRMNNAAIKRQKHIRQSLRAEWIACNGDKMRCPF